MSLFATARTWITNLFGYSRTGAYDAAARGEMALPRQTQYTLNEFLYDGRIYEARGHGGGLEDVLRHYFGRTDAKAVRMAGYFAPFKQIVDAYLNVLPGTFGAQDGMRLADEVDDKPVNPKLPPAIRKLWRDSNLDTEKAEIQRMAANLGTVGMRVVATRSDGGDWSVSIHPVHPGDFTSFEEDDEGNVTAIGLKYARPYNAGTLIDPDWQTVEIEEEISKSEFSRRVDGREQLADESQRNPFGFCPFVILRHKGRGLYGDNAYDRGFARAVHEINYRIGRQNTSIDRHQFPKWFGTAGGPKPSAPIDLGGGETLAYVQTQANTPPPSLTAIVPQIDQAASQAFWMELRDMLRGVQPELVINDVRLLSGVSGETVARILEPARSAILAVRPAYDHAFIRALQMGLSIGAELGLWDIGAGTGAGAGDKSYRGGFEAFQWADRTALPMTTYEKVQQVAAETARRTKDLADAKLAGDLVDEEERLRIAGYTSEQVDEIQERKRKVDVVPTEDEQP